MNEINCPTCNELLIHDEVPDTKVRWNSFNNTEFYCKKCNKTYYLKSNTRWWFVVVVVCALIDRLASLILKVLGITNNVEILSFLLSLILAFVIGFIIHTNVNLCLKYKLCNLVEKK